MCSLTWLTEVTEGCEVKCTDTILFLNTSAKNNLDKAFMSLRCSPFSNQLCVNKCIPFYSQNALTCLPDSCQTHTNHHCISISVEPSQGNGNVWDLTRILSAQLTALIMKGKLVICHQLERKWSWTSLWTMQTKISCLKQNKTKRFVLERQHTEAPSLCKCELPF